MMTTRVLERDEWPRVAHTELGPALELLPVDDTRILVVEHDGVIVGCWACIRYLHAEGVWVHPDHRGRGRVARHLLRGMQELARAWGQRVLLTATLTEEVRRLIVHLGGQPLPGDHYVVPVEAWRCRS